MYMKKSPSFGMLHLVALGCVLSASVSAMVSSYPKLALWKTGSLLLVFLYGATGARLASLGRETRFMAGVLLGCELLVLVTAASYFVGHAQFFGNPNSLGVVTGVVTTPVLLWGLIMSEGTRAYTRRLIAVLLSLLLLLSSYSRAGIGAGVAASFLLCFTFRRYRLLMKGAGLGLLAALLIAATVPLPDSNDVHTDTLVDVFLYKGKTEEGVFGSRQSPWQQTSEVIQLHPWFGAGFGTSVTAVEGPQSDFAVKSSSGSAREHGNSYMAILEWVGLLGVLPFAMLVLVVGANAYRGIVYMRSTSDFRSPLAPITAVLVAGLLHAIFEDWMFACGYYMCVFFWALVFIQADLLPAAETAHAVAMNSYPSTSLDRRYGSLAPGR